MNDSGWVSILVEGGSWETRYVAVGGPGEVLIRTAIESKGSIVTGWTNVLRADVKCYKPPEARSYGLETELAGRGVYWSMSSKDLRDLIFATLLNTPPISSQIVNFPKSLLPLQTRSCRRTCAFSPFIETSAYSPPLRGSPPPREMGRVRIGGLSYSPPRLQMARSPSPVRRQSATRIYFDVVRVARIEGSVLAAVLSIVAVSSKGLPSLPKPSQICISYSDIESSAPSQELFITRVPSPSRVSKYEVDRLIKSCMDNPPPVEEATLIPTSTMSAGDIATEMINRIMTQELDYSSRPTASPTNTNGERSQFELTGDPEQDQQEPQEPDTISDYSLPHVSDQQLKELLQAGWRPPPQSDNLPDTDTTITETVIPSDTTNPATNNDDDVDDNDVGIQPHQEAVDKCHSEPNVDAVDVQNEECSHNDTENDCHITNIVTTIINSAVMFSETEKTESESTNQPTEADIPYQQQVDEPIIDNKKLNDIPVDAIIQNPTEEVNPSLTKDTEGEQQQQQPPNESDDEKELTDNPDQNPIEELHPSPGSNKDPEEQQLQTLHEPDDGDGLEDSTVSPHQNPIEEQDPSNKDSEEQPQPSNETNNEERLEEDPDTSPPIIQSPTEEVKPSANDNNNNKDTIEEQQPSNEPPSKTEEASASCESPKGSPKGKKNKNKNNNNNNNNNKQDTNNNKKKGKKRWWNRKK
eukprot:TRINITY_DN11539_c0_g1_i1.p1 TRINITY_DN11539_c0_g1~~TRINITY_DN11539_c0_g1_i1.p1  ORF type:complete len:696 (+),score=201.08 TRINITY_DN11539_c0_g1_i1:74-2161(+)